MCVDKNGLHDNLSSDNETETPTSESESSTEESNYSKKVEYKPITDYDTFEDHYDDIVPDIDYEDATEEMFY